MAIIVSWFEAEEIFTNTRKTKESPLQGINGQEIGHVRRSLFFVFFYSKWFNVQRNIKQANISICQFHKGHWYLAQIGDNTFSQMWILLSEKHLVFLFPFKHNGRSTGLPVLVEAETDRFGGTQRDKHAAFWSTTDFTGN